MRRRHIPIAIAGALLVGAGTASAQDTTAARSGMPHTMMSGMMEMMRACPMMAAMDQGPQTLLEHADELALTDEQRRRLEELKQARQDARDVLTAAQREQLSRLRRGQAMERMERMMRMMNMMMRMMEGMGETSDSGGTRMPAMMNRH